MKPQMQIRPPLQAGDIVSHETYGRVTVAAIKANRAAGVWEIWVRDGASHMGTVLASSLRKVAA